MARFDNRIPQAKTEIDRLVTAKIVNAAGVAMRRETHTTPYRRGELRQERRVRALLKGARMEWSAPHASVQNRGHRAGARAFTNYTTPGTSSGFVERTIRRFIRELRGGLS